jgi:single-strand DNA-binding protein
MAGVNKVILIGNLGADPELRQTQAGPVCNMRVATTEKWTTQDGQKQERTEWHTVVVWGRMAENCQRYLAKGRPVYIEGSLRSRTYTDQEGKERRVWDVQAQTVQFLGGGPGGDQCEGDQPHGGGGGWGGGGSQGGGGGQQRRPSGGQGGQQSGGGGGWGGGSQGGGGGGWGAPPQSGGNDPGPGFDDDDLLQT